MTRGRKFRLNAFCGCSWTKPSKLQAKLKLVEFLVLLLNNLKLKLRCLLNLKLHTAIHSVPCAHFYYRTSCSDLRDLLLHSNPADPHTHGQGLWGPSALNVEASCKFLLLTFEVTELTSDSVWPKHIFSRYFCVLRHCVCVCLSNAKERGRSIKMAFQP